MNRKPPHGIELVKSLNSLSVLDMCDSAIYCNVAVKISINFCKCADDTEG